jgi:hypothetical protein
MEPPLGGSGGLRERGKRSAGGDFSLTVGGRGRVIDNRRRQVIVFREWCGVLGLGGSDFLGVMGMR